MSILRQTLGLCNKNIWQACKFFRAYATHAHTTLSVDLPPITPDENIRTARIQDYLSTFKRKELIKLASSCGVNSSGNKPQLVDTIVTHFKPFTSISSNPYPHFEMPKSIISIDVGYRNLSYVQLSAKNEILAWHLINLNLENFENNTFAIAVSNFVHEHLVPKLMDVGAFVIEQQRYRSGGTHSVFDRTLHVNAVAYILTGILVDRFKVNSANFFNGNVVHNVIPQRVAKFHKIDEPPKRKIGTALADKKSLEKKKAEGLKRKKNGVHEGNDEDMLSVDVGDNDLTSFSIAAKIQQARSKKVRAKHLVSVMLSSDKYVLCPEKLKTMYLESEKKDDLSDCLLQGLAWYGWARFSIEQAKELNTL